MAILRLGGLANAISGSIAGTTFAHTKGGTVARSKLRQRKTTGAVQARLRSDMSRQRAVWRGLSDQQRQAWRVVALELPRANRLGQRNVLSGYQLFIRINMDGQRGSTHFTNDPPFTDPPDFTSFELPGMEFITFSVSGGYFYQAIPTFLPPFKSAAIYGARTFRDYETGVVPSLRMFFLGTDLFGPQDITAPWDSHIGPPSVGEFIFIRFRWGSGDHPYSSLPLDFRVQVTA